MKCIVFVMILSNLFISSLIAMDGKVLVTGGISVGEGIAAGRACVVTGLSQLTKICTGDIVVASTTNSSWNDALKKSAGIITEIGDGNSHAALLGKKLGIPVIVGVSEATKKIVDGSSISFDCARTVVYEVVQKCIHIGKSSISPIVSQGYVNYGPLSFGGQEYSVLEHTHYNPTSEKKTKKISLKKKDKYQKDKHYHNNMIDITRDRLHNDVSLIKAYVAAAKSDIGLAKDLGKWVVTWRITGYAYDSIPFAFCDDQDAQDEAFKKLTEGAEYIQEKKEEFKQKILGKSTTIDNSKIAEFLYHSAVENVNVTQELRKILKEDPTKMDEYVRDGIIDKAQYMYYTLLNFTARYYLEQELQKK